MSQDTLYYTVTILLLTIHVLSKSLSKYHNTVFFRAIFSINFSIRKTFYFIFDKIGHLIYFNTFKLIVFFYFFSTHCWIDFSVFLHVFFLFFLCLLQTYSVFIFSILYYFLFCFFKHSDINFYHPISFIFFFFR